MSPNRVIWFGHIYIYYALGIFWFICIEKEYTYNIIYGWTSLNRRHVTIEYLNILLKKKYNLKLCNEMYTIIIQTLR